MTGIVLALLMGVGIARAAAPSPPVDAEPVPELRLGIPLVVQVLGGERFDGAFVAWERDHLLLSTRDGQQEIGSPLIQSVEVEGTACSPQAFVEGVRRWSEAQRLDALFAPPPALVGSASALWAGAGPAILGRWDSFLAYSLVEASLLGAGGVMIARGQYGPLLPLAALDVLVRAWAVGDSVHEARRRQRRAHALVGFAPLEVPERHGAAVGLTVTVRWPANGASAVGSGTLGAPSAAGLTAAGPFPY